MKKSRQITRDGCAKLSIKGIHLFSRVFVLLLFSPIFLIAKTNQDPDISVAFENQKVKQVLSVLESKSDYRFFYSEDAVDLNRKISLEMRNKAFFSVVKRLFEESGTAYKVKGKQIILQKIEKKKNAPVIQDKGITVKGTVKNNIGEGIPGATVFVKGTSKGTNTDIDGNFVLKGVNQEDVLVFTFIGMQPQELAVGSRTVFDVVMQDDVVGLEEVVVVGYGSMKKKDMTGSIVSVKSEELASMPVPSVGNAIQGKATGVQVVESGKPGDDPTFRIRGIGTINKNNPLLVIDGVPTTEGLNQLNMNDIESLQVLKDASATAIYGSRGANGVIIVTTKKGSKDRSEINFNAYVGVQKPTNTVDMLNATQFASLHNEMMENAGEEKNPKFANPESLTQNTDWIGELLSPGVMQNYSLSYSGGNEKSTYYVSGNYFDQKGIVLNTGYKRFTLQFNSESYLKDNLKFGNTLTLNYDKKYKGSYDVKSTLLALPTLPVYNADGTYAGPTARPSWEGDIVNPIGKATIEENQIEGYNLLGSVYGEYEIIEGLKFKSTAGLKLNLWKERSWTPKYDWDPTPKDLAELYEKFNRKTNWTWDNTLTYSRVFNDIHSLNVMVGMSAQEEYYDFLSGSIKGFSSDKTQELTNGTVQPKVDGTANDWSLLSFMGRLNYSLMDRYLLTLTLRRDGSSRFGANNRWGYFPSASFAWRISDEEFFENVENINNLKFRAGYGVTGNQEIGNYSYAAVLSTNKYNFNNNLVNTVSPSIMPNPNVMWESQKQTNVGLDMGMFDSRIELSVDAYYKNTQDMLVPMSVPVSTGYNDVAVPFINAGEIVNKGIEINLSTLNMEGDFTWNTDFNISFNKNEVISLNDTIPMSRGNIGLNYNLARIEAGYPVDVFYGYVTDGLFQTQEEVDAHAQQVPGADPHKRTSAGDIRFKDLNSDGIIDDKDRTYLGNPNPDFIFSLNNSFAYKNFDLSIFLQGVYGSEIFNANRIWSEGMAVTYNQSSETLNRWNGEGTSNDMPRAVFNDPNKNTRASDRYIEDGSYLRIKNVTLGYTFPESVLEKINLHSLRVYASAVNLYTFSNYKGFDPEVGVNGIDNNVYPVNMTFSVGANVSF